MTKSHINLKWLQNKYTRLHSSAKTSQFLNVISTYAEQRRGLILTSYRSYRSLIYPIKKYWIPSNQWQLQCYYGLECSIRTNTNAWRKKLRRNCARMLLAVLNKVLPHQQEIPSGLCEGCMKFGEHATNDGL